MRTKYVFAAVTVLVVAVHVALVLTSRTLQIDLSQTRKALGSPPLRQCAEGINELPHVKTIRLTLPEGHLIEDHVRDLLIQIQQGEIEWIRWCYEERTRDEAADDIRRAAKLLDADVRDVDGWVRGDLIGNYLRVTRRANMEIELQVRPTFNLDPQKKWTGVVRIVFY